LCLRGRGDFFFNVVTKITLDLDVVTEITLDLDILLFF
jgi:hypothetical protein